MILTATTKAFFISALLSMPALIQGGYTRGSYGSSSSSSSTERSSSNGNSNSNNGGSNYGEYQRENNYGQTKEKEDEDDDDDGDSNSDDEKTQTVCLAKGVVTKVSGSTTELVGSSQFPCLDPTYVQTAQGWVECGAYYANPADLSALTLATVDFLEAGEGTTWDEPLFFNSNDVLNTASFQISTEQASPNSFNGSSFKGSVGTSNAINKVTLQFMDLSPLADIALALDPTSTFQYNANLFNEPASSIESIQYDFYPAVCNGLTNCYKQFYLNIYLRSSARAFGDTTSGAWRDCNLAYVPPSGPEGQWTTFKIDANTPVTQARDCPANFATLGEAQEAGYVLGTNLGLIYLLSMGDTSANDNGLVGYFDNLRLKLVGEDVRIYDL